MDRYANAAFCNNRIAANADRDLLKADNSIRDINSDPGRIRNFLGMKQRLGIACANMENPQLLVLDEPFNALDSAGEELLKEILTTMKSAGTLIVLSCHDKETLESLSDEIFAVEQGRFLHEGSERK